MSQIVLNYTAEKRVKISTFLETRGFGRQNIFELIHDQNVLIDNVGVKGRNEIVNTGSEVKVTLSKETNNLKINELPINIVYEDDYILVVNKPYNLDVEPSLHTTTNNLSSMISYYFNQHDIPSKIHLVNRLDKLTSGLVIVAKNRYIKNLFTQIKITKKYKCLVDGETEQEGTIINKIRKADEGSKRIVSEDGKPCKTSFKRINYDGNKSLLEVTLHSGRTHQIRVTFASLGHPLSNDPMYNENPVDGDMYLEAYYLNFIHPITGENIELTTGK